MQKNRFAVRVLLAAALCFLPAVPALADMPVLEFRAEAPRTAGLMPDGTVLGRGRLTYTGPHTGFRLWMEGERQGSSPERYVLTAPPGAPAPVRVRLEADRGRPDGETGRGVLSMTTESSISFRVVADGNQHAAAGMWSARISAMAVLGE
ncbi:AfaD family invasin [Enterobacter kobei]|uniref:AfaD family invasin n=1 Tax=Enterobacter kobei TaxID=208224 RepID=UPI002A8180F8|nr:AfaD family invasin [Enterobacter kobei]HDJ1437433.1 hypothetical protein [Enterobacter asburiae]